eukprot:4707269-Prymnesium_polylepis.2
MNGHSALWGRGDGVYADQLSSAGACVWTSVSALGGGARSRWPRNTSAGARPPLRASARRPRSGFLDRVRPPPLVRLARYRWRRCSPLASAGRVQDSPYGLSIDATRPT